MATNDPVYSVVVKAQHGDGPVEVLYDGDGLTLRECNKLSRAYAEWMASLCDFSDAMIDGEISDVGTGATGATVTMVAEIQKAGKTFALQRNEWPNTEPMQWVVQRATFHGHLYGGVDKSLRQRGKAKGKAK